MDCTMQCRSARKRCRRRPRNSKQKEESDALYWLKEENNNNNNKDLQAITNGAWCSAMTLFLLLISVNRKRGSA